MNHLIPADHPRHDSLIMRERLIKGYEKHVVAASGLIAHGRGEAFDYLFGEKTNDFALASIQAAAAALILANHPVISVNGNVAALMPKSIVELSNVSRALLEVNLFYRTPKRERAVASALKKAGAKKILGVGTRASETIPELGSERRRVDPLGIAIADVVFVPLEDGDRTEALIKLGKTVITIDLNPLSRTAREATITIVDNCTRAIPLLVEAVSSMRGLDKTGVLKVLSEYDNKKAISLSLDFVRMRLEQLSKDERSENK